MQDKPNDGGESNRPPRLVLLVVALFGLTGLLMMACGSDAGEEAGVVPQGDPVDTDAASESDQPSDDEDEAVGEQAAEEDATESAPEASSDQSAGDEESSADPSDDGVESESEPEPESESEPEPGTEADGPLLFSTHVEPVLSAKCASCHVPGGPGAPHFPLDEASDAVVFADFIKSNVEIGAMPPWPATAESVPFHDDRSLTQEEVDAIVEWVDAGSELDVADDSPIESSEPIFRLGEVDDTLAPVEGYQGTAGSTDDYRCLAYPTNVEEDTHLLGWEFLADQTEVVHHAIGVIAGPGADDEIAALDARDPGPGWSCFGSTEVASESGIFLAWAPGQGPTEYPEGTGLAVPAGSTIVIQIHYHYENSAPLDVSTLDVNWADDSDGEIDTLSISQLIGPAEIPCLVGETNPLCDRDAALARNLELFGAGIGSQVPGFINRRCDLPAEALERTTDGLAETSCDLPAPRGEIVSIMAHEHEIGTKWRLTLNPDTPEERILLDIDEWDFDWQYNYYPTESIELGRDDVLRLECAWDRALIKPGLDLGYILWADGTNDEMCFANMVTR